MPVAVTGIAHVNLNCRSLARSRPFYERALGLKPLIHTNPEPQDCTAFGLAGDGQWDAWMMCDGRGPLASAALDLLEWKRPLPAEPPEDAARQLGLRALGFRAPDLAAAAQRLRDAGASITGPTAKIDLGDTEPVPFFTAEDPDGSLVVVAAGDAVATGELRWVEIGCTDLARSEPFYRDVVGLEVVGRSRSAPDEDEAVFETCALAPASAPDGFRVSLTRWTRPAPAVGPQTEANQLGLFRMALLVEDLDAAHGALERAGAPDLTAPVTLDLGPDCPARLCRALFFRDPDGACLELIETPQVG